VQHVAQNGLTPDEVEDVLLAVDEIGTSASTGLPMVFGFTSTGKYIGVVFHIIEESPLAVRVVTAFETEF
jgi:hypothetical protein